MPGRDFGASPGRGIGIGEDGNLRAEEELRQVQEMPEEEEAEAREMVSRSKRLKFLFHLKFSKEQVLIMIIITVLPLWQKSDLCQNTIDIPL